MMNLLHDDITVKEALCFAADKLKKAGIAQSRSEAEIILAGVMNAERWKLYTKEGAILSPAVKRDLLNAINRRENRCPVAYITGKKEFYGFDFYVSPAVLIPRPETEILIDAVVNRLKETGNHTGEKIKIVDLGTGSGVIAVTLARLLPRSELWAVDISPAALSIARQNSLMHGVEKRIRFLQGNYWDLFTGKYFLFNVIISNPPYIPRSQIENLPPEIKEHEPREALDGGEDGLDAFRCILNKAGRHSASPALLALETGAENHRAVKELCRREPVVKKLESVKDYRGYERVILGTISF